MITGATDKLYEIKKKVKPVVMVLVSLWLFINVVIPVSKFAYSCNQKGVHYTIIRYTQGEYRADLWETSNLYRTLFKDIKEGWL